MLNRLIVITVILLSSLLSNSAYAQLEHTEVVKDTVPFKISLIDSSYYNVDIFKLLEERSPNEGRVHIRQNQAVAEAVRQNINQQREKRLYGYRVRIFFDNNRTARARSEAIVAEFSATYPEIPVYREYTNPYFRVSVGDFRTKSEALYMKRLLESSYPKVFIVQDQINYPPL